MSRLYSVRRADGKLVAQHHTRELAEREIGWHLASGNAGPYRIESITREPDTSRWGYGHPNRFAGKWPAAKVDEFRKRYMAREPVMSLADYFGTSVVIVCRMARRLGFCRRIDDPATFEQHRGRWTEREERLVNLMYDEGIGTSKIPESIPRSQGAVEARLTTTAPTLSTRSKFGRFIAKGKPGRKRIHRVLEEASGPSISSEESS